MNRIIKTIKSGLLWSQKYTHTDMLFLAKNGTWLTLARAVGTVLAFVTAILFANLLPSETYGTYKYVFSIFSIFAVTTLPQMTSANVRAVARGYEGSILKTIRPMILWGSLGAAGCLAVAAYYYAQGNHVLAGSFVVIAFFLPFLAPSSNFDDYLSGKKLFRTSTWYAIIQQVLSTLMSVVTLLVTKNVVYLLIAYFGSRTVINAALFAYTVRKFKPNKKTDPETETYGKHLTLMGGISTLASYLDDILVYHFLGAQQLAIYAIAIGPAEQLKSLISVLDTMLFPSLAQKSSQEIRAGMRSKFINLFIFGLIVVGGYIVAVPYVFRLAFPGYHDSIFYSQLFALSMLNLTFFPAVSYLRAKKMIREQYQANIVSSLFQIAVMVLFILKWGLLGLVVARILSRYVSVLISLFFYHRVADTDEASPLRTDPV